MTDRLSLRPATIELLRAALGGNDVLGSTLNARVPSSWPPEFIDEAVLRWMLQQLEARPLEGRWWMYFVLLRSDAGDRDARPTLVGTAGYKGPPNEEGSVEVGYSIVTSHQRQGYATEATRALIDAAFADGNVTSVAAETLPDGVASQGVLRKCGFLGPHPVPRRADAEASDPVVVRYLRTRP